MLNFAFIIFFVNCAFFIVKVHLASFFFFFSFLEMIYDPSWPDKNAVTLGFVSGVAVDPSGNVHVFHRGPRIWDIQ